MIWFSALISVIFVSLISLLGAVFLVLRRQTFEKIITYTLAFSSGVLLGSAFLDLLPESLKVLPKETFPLTITGIIFFFALEKLLAWHHHIEGDHPGKNKRAAEAAAYMSLLGDGIHNFVDGVIIGAAYVASYPLGVATTVAVVAHEVPHELADFTILIYGGFSNGKALFLNFLSALTAIAGTIIVLIASTRIAPISQYLVPFAAGNFIYIAASDLIPELHKKRHLVISIVQLLAIIFGIFIISLFHE